MKYDFLILGASGMQGKIVARDLLERGYKILLADLYKEGSLKNLKRFPNQAKFSFIDLRRIGQTVELIKKSGADVVINCAECDWNLNVYKAALKTRRHIIDLDSDLPTTKIQLALDNDFRRRNLTAITGCGSTPGINNVMLRYASQFFDTIETINAGFAWDSNIKKFVTPFCIPTVLWEFIQPAPIIEDGRWFEKKPLETIIEMELRGVGRQKCFIVEHAETLTFHHYFKNRGLKNIRFFAGFPQHTVKVVLALIEANMTLPDYVIIDDKNGLKAKIWPADVIAKVMEAIPYPEGYTETENLWVEIWGKNGDGRMKRIVMECLVPPLPGWEDAGCNIDTGFPAAIIAQMIKDGRISRRGSFSPEAEKLVPVEEFYKELRQRGLLVYQNGKLINGDEMVEAPVKVEEATTMITNGSKTNGRKTLVKPAVGMPDLL